MMRRPLIAANWKMQKIRDDALGFVRQFVESLPEANQIEIALFPPSLYLAEISAIIKETSIHLGAQNIFWEEFGSYTGEISAPMIRSVGARYVLIGHSERRIHLHESDEEIGHKVEAAFRSGCAPILCVGEQREERDAGRMPERLQDQLDLGLAQIERSQAHGVTLAYEPVWAIGTGMPATPEEAEKVHEILRGMLGARYGDDIAQSIRIIYGGSVTSDNVAELVRQEHVDGVLVGGASLDVEHFVAIVQAVSALTSNDSPEAAT